MPRRFWSYVVAKKAVSVCLLLSITLLGYSHPVLADSEISSGNVIIVANIKPVRIILVDDRSRITEIQSNSSANITPIVYQGSYDTESINLTPDVYNQYSTIMVHTNLHRTGVIYKHNYYKSSKATTVNKMEIISITLKNELYYDLLCLTNRPLIVSFNIVTHDI
jgi:hypothetical protein